MWLIWNCSVQHAVWKCLRWSRFIIPSFLHTYTSLLPLPRVFEWKLKCVVFDKLWSFTPTSTIYSKLGDFSLPLLGISNMSMVFCVFLGVVWVLLIRNSEDDVLAQPMATVLRRPACAELSQHTRVRGSGISSGIMAASRVWRSISFRGGWRILSLTHRLQERHLRVLRTKNEGNLRAFVIMRSKQNMVSLSIQELCRDEGRPCNTDEGGSPKFFLWQKVPLGLLFIPFNALCHLQNICSALTFIFQTVFHHVW